MSETTFVAGQVRIKRQKPDVWNQHVPYVVGITGEAQVPARSLAEAKAYCRTRWGVTKWKRGTKPTDVRGASEAYYWPLDGTCQSWD